MATEGHDLLAENYTVGFISCVEREYVAAPAVLDQVYILPRVGSYSRLNLQIATIVKRK